MSQPSSAQRTAVRGVVLLLVLAALGALVVNKGFHGSSRAAAAPKTVATVPVANTDGTATTVVSTTVSVGTAAPVTPSVADGTTKIVVVNGTKVTGAAGRLAGKLTAAGFTVTGKFNPLSKAVQATTTVFYLEGFKSQAARVAQMIASTTITPTTSLLPAQLPIKKADLGDAQVLVLLGTDLAV